MLQSEAGRLGAQLSLRLGLEQHRLEVDSMMRGEGASGEDMVVPVEAFLS
jgi:hypothetical protein